MIITAQAPCRIDLAGGTLDIWPLYLFHSNAVTVNFAINCFARCLLAPRSDGRIVMRSDDQNEAEVFDSLKQLRAAPGYRLPLAAYLAKFFAPPSGFNLYTHSQSPAGGGIAGSSTLIICVSSVLNRFTGAGYSLEEIRPIAQNIEAQIIRVPTGCQDYYPAMYGGVSAIELREDGIRRQAISVNAAELNERFVLAYTGAPRNSGINNWEVTKAYVDGQRTVHRNFDQITAISQAMRRALEQGAWDEAGRLLREEWAHRRANYPGITTPLIDELVKFSRRAGALGAKVCGAGGGGCVFFLVQRGAKARVSEVLRARGALVMDVKAHPRGVRVRTLPLRREVTKRGRRLEPETR